MKAKYLGRTFEVVEIVDNAVILTSSGDDRIVVKHELVEMVVEKTVLPLATETSSSKKRTAKRDEN